MANERENYCRLLGLNPFKEDSYTEQKLTAAIDRIEEKWNKDLRDRNSAPKVKYQAEENLKLVADMRDVMDHTILRQEEFEKGREILRRKATKLKRSAIVLPNGDIVLPGRKVEELVKKIQWENIDGKTFIAASGLKIVPTPRSVDNTTSAAFRTINELGCYSPYEFVNNIIGIHELDLHLSKVEENGDPDKFRIACDTIGKRLANVKNGTLPNLDAYIGAIRGIKTNYDDEPLKKLVEYGKCRKAVEPILAQMEEDEGDIQFNREYIDNLLITYASDGVDHELCLRLIVEHCIKRAIAANFSLKDSKLGQCPRCRAMMFKGNDVLFCPCCGSAVSEICPCCGTAQTAGNSNCVGCGAELAPSLRSVRQSEDEIRKLIIEGNLGRASEAVSGLETAYPAIESAAKLKEKIKEAYGRINALVDRITDDYTGRNYADLIRAVDNGTVEFPSLSEKEEVRRRYTEAKKKFDEADELCVQAVNASEEEAKELYIRASDICPDHPDAVSKLRNYPPEGPADGVYHSESDGIEISYAVPEERRGLTFCIYRNEGSYPEVDQTTKPLAETEGWVYTDMATEPGVEYYYRIYSKRWGVLSQEYAECGPCVVIREVTNVKIEPCEDGLRITYLPPKGCTHVRIWRKESGNAIGVGDEDEILHNDSGTVFDDSLVSGTVYHYLFVAEYEIGGIQHRSYGTEFSGLTAVLPQPISDLTVRWDRRHRCYTAKWTGSQDAVLYYSDRKDAVTGQRLSPKVLETEMNRIEPLDSDDGTFRFTLPDTTVTYVFPVLNVGTTYIRGKECVVANLRPFGNVSKTVDGYDCAVRMAWPENADSASVEIAGKNEDGEDAVEEFEVSREEYSDADGIQFRLNGSLRTAVTLRAVYDIDGVKQKSIGVTTDIFTGSCSKVKYRLCKESVKGDRKKVRIDVDFECPGENSVPRCVMIAVKEGIPLRRTDGEQIWESDDPVILSDGKCQCSFVIPKEIADLGRMRLFFPDRKNYGRYRFVHPVYRRK